jgi:uncharacterized protein (TIGR03437 family)
MGGVPANVLFSRIGPGFGALYQINLQIPANAT